MDRTRTFLSVSMVLLMIGMMLLPAAMAANVDPYTVEVSSGQSTTITATPDVTFGTLDPGTSDNTIPDSFQLTNVGNADATVNAKFTTFNATSSIYGLTNASLDAIGGANFSMELTGVGYTDLKNTDTDTLIASSNVAADAVADVWNVQLDIPAGTPAAIYTGTVQLTFADA